MLSFSVIRVIFGSLFFLMPREHQLLACGIKNFALQNCSLRKGLSKVQQQIAMKCSLCYDT